MNVKHIEVGLNSNIGLRRKDNQDSACASHGVLSGPAIERIQNSPIKELTILDTIPLTSEKKLDNINVLSVAPVFTEAIARIYEETSVSTLFD